jgi:xanthosine utilization system XapX-like protein
VHELGTNPNVADADSDGDLLSDELELQLGTDPGTAFSPWSYVALFLLVGAFVGTQMYRAGWRIQREQRSVRGRRVLVPTVTRIGGETASTRSREHERTPPASGQSARSTDAEPVHPREPPGGTAEPAGVTAGAASTADSAGATDQPEAGTSDDAPSRQDLPEQAFLTDADRVTQILEDAGGNCRQQDIVRETGWSKSKVSRLLSQMADDDEVRKISLGRENVIVLPGEEPDAVRSALDDE